MGRTRGEGGPVAHDRTDRAGQGRNRRLTVGLLLALVLVGAVGVIAAWRFAEHQKVREVQAWQARLQLIAQDRAQALSRWIRQRQALLAELADNPSVQLYVAESLKAPDQALAERGYLRNLLIAQADRFVPEPMLDAPAPRSAQAGGLALIARDGQRLAGSPGLPPLPAIGRDQPVIFTPGLGLVLSHPVVPVQDMAANPLALAVALVATDAGLADVIQLPIEPLVGASTYLVYERNGNHVPLAGGPEDTAARQAFTASQMVRAVDHRGRDVLAVAEPVPVPALDWAVVRSVPAREVLGPIERRRNQTIAILAVAVLGLIAVILAAWRHGASVRVAAAHARQAELTQRYEALSDFLTTVADSQPAAILALDMRGVIRFANRAAAARARRPAAELVGNSLDAVYTSPDAAVFRADAPGETRIDDRPGPPRQVTQIRTLPLKGREDGRLVVAEDITELVEARERRESGLRDLVATLTSLIDARDPYSAHHSARVAEVAVAIARAMDCSPLQIETVEIAGTLMNLGKMMVPREVLTKRGDLSAGELRAVRESLMKSADLLETLNFEGPISETLRQVQAHVDGSGRPAGLAGPDILITARILAVANAFVGMISPRAHRLGLSMDKALGHLYAAADTLYDRRVVSALAYCLDNGGGRQAWAHFAERPGLPTPEKSEASQLSG